MNILFVDDEKNFVDVAINHLKDNGYSCEYLTFENFNLENENFDIIVIDMMNGVTGDPQGTGGKKIIAQIWESNFCPIIIYSADPGLADIEKHPLISKIQKGKDSEEKLLAATQKMQLFVEAKNSIIQHTEQAVQNILRETIPGFFDDVDNDLDVPEERKQHLADKIATVFPRVIRRRIAAEFDSGYNTEKLLPYEQYLYPALGNNWLQGDIVRNKTTGALYLVLTPSCDLEIRKGKLKTRSILCATCQPFNIEDIKDFFHYSSRVRGCRKCSECDTNSNECHSNRLVEKHKEEQQQFVSMLNSGIVGDFYVLPALADKIGNMLADLKNLFIINVDEMDKFERVVSIDSPFREKLNEVFIRTAGRIGPPDRDFNPFAEECINTQEAK